MVSVKIKHFLVISVVFASENLSTAEHDELLDFRKMVLNKQNSFLEAVQGLKEQDSTSKLLTGNSKNLIKGPT